MRIKSKFNKRLILMKISFYLCTFFIRQKLLFGKTVIYERPCRTSGDLVFSLTHVTCMALHTVVIRYSTSVTWGMLRYASGHLVIYHECYRFERALFTLRGVLPCIPSCFFQGFPGASISTSKSAGLHANIWNIALARLFVWITAIHNRFICGRFYLRAMAGQSQNIKLHRELI